MRTSAALWYLRTVADHDTHAGRLIRSGYVQACCGVQFAPRLAAYGRLALPSWPLDPDQICAQCQKAVAR